MITVEKQQNNHSRYFLSYPMSRAQMSSFRDVGKVSPRRTTSSVHRNDACRYTSYCNNTLAVAVVGGERTYRKRWTGCTGTTDRRSPGRLCSRGEISRRDRPDVDDNHPLYTNPNTVTRPVQRTVVGGGVIIQRVYACARRKRFAARPTRNVTVSVKSFGFHSRGFWRGAKKKKLNLSAVFITSN